MFETFNHKCLNTLELSISHMNLSETSIKIELNLNNEFGKAVLSTVSVSRKKIRHMWGRWGTPQNLFLEFIDKLEKQIIIKKLLKWANKKQNNLNIYHAVFKKNKNKKIKKEKKNTCRYHYLNLDDMTYSSWDIKQNILKLLILGHFLPFYPDKTPKNQNFKKWKNLLETSSQYMMYSSWDTEWDRQNVWSFWAIFCFFTMNPPLPPPSPTNDPENQNFEKKLKIPGDIILLYIHVYHKWRSYDIWFLINKVW